MQSVWINLAVMFQPAHQNTGKTIHGNMTLHTRLLHQAKCHKSSDIASVRLTQGFSLHDQ